MTPSIKRLAITLCTAVLVTACASAPPEPEIDFKQDYDFHNVRKIAFYDESGHVSGDNPMQLSDIQTDRIDEAFTFALQGRGLTVVNDPKEADLLISWHLVTQHKTDVRTYQSAPSYGASYGRYGGYNRYSRYNCWNCSNTEVSVKNYTEGTFIVDMIDTRLKKSVWRSVTQSKLKGEPNDSKENLNEAANRILGTFPY